MVVMRRTGVTHVLLDFFGTLVDYVPGSVPSPAGCVEHPEICAEVLRRLDIGAEQAVFVGDSYLADFVGPQEAGIRAYLIDPAGVHQDVPTDQRLRSLDDLPARL